jgi:hypothetical protein
MVIINTCVILCVCILLYCRHNVVQVTANTTTCTAVFQTMSYCYIVMLMCIITNSIHCLTSVYWINTPLHLTFCWPCIIMYHSNVTNLIHFHFHNHVIVSWSSTCFGHQVSIFRRHYTSSFWCELRAVVAFGWLQVVACVVPPEDGCLMLGTCIQHLKPAYRAH